MDRVLPFADFVVDCLRSVELAILVYIRELHGLTDDERPGIRLLSPDNHHEESRLAGAVGADPPYDSAAWERESKRIKQDLVPISLSQSVRIHDVVAKPGRGRNDDLVLRDA